MVYKKNSALQGLLYGYSLRQTMYKFSVVTQQTRDIDPMLRQCWNNVVDGGPALAQHWINVSFLLGSRPNPAHHMFKPRLCLSEI